MDTLADYEPLDYYTETLRDAVQKNAAADFDELVRQSGVDAKKNAATVARYDAAAAKARHAEKKLNSCKLLRGFVIFFTVVAFLAAALLIILHFAGEGDRTLLWIGIPCAVVGAALLVLLFTKLKKLLKQREDKYAKAVSVAEGIKAEAMAQMRPLHALFTWDMVQKVFRKTVPFLHLDDRFDVRKADLLARKYGYAPDDDANSSTVFLLSGSVDGNPFLFERKFRCTMGVRTYTGSIVIHWTTTERDPNGNWHTEHHSQTLEASVTKPAPYYRYETDMIYGNEAAPDLTFSREPTHANELNEKELERKIKRGKKKLAKKTRDAIAQGKRFTEMGSAEFDVLFGATDRNNEVQFRLLFTPLAQVNMLDLIKSDEGYGDDFAFRKQGCINRIRSEHAQRWQAEIDPSRFAGYDLAAVRKDFIACAAEYLKSVFFDLAPVLALPLYRQQEPQEFIYRDVYPFNYTGEEAEVLANKLGDAAFAPANAKTQCILKAKQLAKDGLTDRISVTAHSFDTAEHTEFIAVMGGDGRMHNVPVCWTEYIPVSAEVPMALKEVGGTRESFEYKRAGSDLAEFVRKFARDGATAFGDGLIAFPLQSGHYDEAADAELGNLFGIQAAATAAFVVGAEAVAAAADALDRSEKEEPQATGDADTSASAETQEAATTGDAEIPTDAETQEAVTTGDADASADADRPQTEKPKED